MWMWFYKCFHIPTGTLHAREWDIKHHGIVTREEFLAKLSEWNRQGAGKWQYWEA